MKLNKNVGWLFLLAALPVMAAPINGVLQIDGKFTVGATFLNFCASATVGDCPAAPGNWNPPGLGTGDLSNPYGNDPNGGLITNLNSGNAPVGTLLAGNGILFLTFAPSGALPVPDIQLYLTKLLAGAGDPSLCSAAPAPGQTCTPAGSAVTFLNVGSGSSATVTALGLARRISTNEFDPLLIGFSTTFNTPFQTVLASFATAGGTLSKTYNGTFTATPVPEPVTVALIGFGLFAFGLLGRRAVKK